MSLKQQNSSSEIIDPDSIAQENIVRTPSKLDSIKFDGKDFPTWKFRTVSMLLGYGLLGIVDGVETGSSKSYLARRDLVYAALVASLTDETLKCAMTVKPGDACGIWKNLHAEYERNTRSNRINLRRQLYDLCGTKNLSLSELVSKINLLCSRLEFLNVNISDEDKLTILLTGARKEFSAIVAIIEMAEDTQTVTYADAVDRLKDYERKDDALAQSNENHLSVLAVKKSISEIQCFNCLKFGHYKSHCPLLPKKTLNVKLNPSIDSVW